MPKSPKRILFLFVDGLGIGKNDADVNPLARTWSHLESVNHGEAWTEQSDKILKIDANLSFEGLPQSGTGQATLFTGENCSELAGKHFGPYPHSKTKSAIAEKNIFQRLLERGFKKDELSFLNAYPDRFFSFVEKTGRWTVTTLACKSSGIKLREKDDVLSANAITADLTGQGWSRIGHDLPFISPKEAGRRLMKLAQAHSFSLFEYYLTDKAGHSLDMERANSTISHLDKLVSGVLDQINPDEDLLVITSDHGNIEDMSTKTHTRNPVPLILYPPMDTDDLEVESLVDVVHLILHVLTPPQNLT